MTKRQDRDPMYRKRQFDSDIIVLCVRWYITYRLSYRAQNLPMAIGAGYGFSAPVAWDFYGALAFRMPGAQHQIARPGLHSSSRNADIEFGRIVLGRNRLNLRSTLLPCLPQVVARLHLQPHLGTGPECGF